MIFKPENLNRERGENLWQKKLQKKSLKEPPGNLPGSLYARRLQRRF
jgi:hypothetical protein